MFVRLRGTSTEFFCAAGIDDVSMWAGPPVQPWDPGASCLPCLAAWGRKVDIFWPNCETSQSKYVALAVTELPRSPVRVLTLFFFLDLLLPRLVDASLLLGIKVSASSAGSWMFVSLPLVPQVQQR